MAFPPTVLPDRATFRIGGAEAADFLQKLVTADVTRLATGQLAHTALLTPQGKVASCFFLRREEAGFAVDALASDKDALMSKFGLYRLRAKVTIEDAADEVVRASGTRAAGFAPDPREAALGFRAVTPRGEVPPDHAGDPDAYEAHRVALGVPEFGRDYGPGEVFPMDVNLDRLGSVDYKKGCFVGQEVASRMFRKGEVRKRSWTVTAEGPLAAGEAVTAGGSTLGTVTSALGGRGIALLRVDRVLTASEPAMVGDQPVTLSAPGHLEAGGAG